jgi:hypothetical protein
MGQAGSKGSDGEAHEPILVSSLNFLVLAGLDRVVLPMLGDIDPAHWCAGVIYNA